MTAVTNENFLDPLVTEYDLHGFNYYVGLEDDSQRSMILVREMKQNTLAGHLEKLDNRDCIRAYAQMFLSSRSNLLLISDGFP